MRSMQAPRSIPVVAAMLLLTALAACALGRSGAVYSSQFTAGYDPFSLRAAMSRAPLPVEVYGGPAPNVAQDSVSRATVLALRQYGPYWLPGNYMEFAADSDKTPYHLRIAFGLPKSFKRQLLCSEAMGTEAIEAVRGTDDAGSTRTLAGLCRGTRAIAISEGSPGAEVGIADDKFNRFVGLLGRKTMPWRNPVLDDDCRFRSCD